ncbi:MAG TPA: PIN domain-containing protein [Lacipirellulaceae bacterium]|nr:PIN domain-containing protein [Lacipirellulaceae bacterium]
MTLCDTGPLVALVDDSDQHQQFCRAALSTLPPSPLITTWPCLTEAMYLLGCVAGIDAQNRLWSYLTSSLIKLYMPGEDEWLRIHHLMQEYADMPLDMADASLFSAAEHLNDYRLFTVDQSLRAVRVGGHRHFDIVP